MSRSSSTPHDRSAQFGPNEWLVEEMYEQFLANPSTVDPAWHDFFADYRPAPPGDNGKMPCTGTQASPKQPPTNGTTAREQTVVGTQAQHKLELDTTTPLRGAAARVVANMEPRWPFRRRPVFARCRRSCSPTTAS